MELLNLTYLALVQNTRRSMFDKLGCCGWICLDFCYLQMISHYKSLCPPIMVFRSKTQWNDLAYCYRQIGDLFLTNEIQSCFCKSAVDPFANPARVVRPASNSSCLCRSMDNANCVTHCSTGIEVTESWSLHTLSSKAKGLSIEIVVYTKREHVHCMVRYWPGTDYYINSFTTAD